MPAADVPGSLVPAGPYLELLIAQLRRMDIAALDRWSALLYRAWEQGRFVFLVGNGGSAVTASHMCEDLAKGTLRPSALRDESTRRFRVLSLTDNVGWITAIANDISYDEVFVQQLMSYGSRGDVVVAISGSGNSPNVLKAVDWANRNGLATFGVTGFDGGQLKQIQQDGLNVGVDDMGMVESLHLLLHHWVLNDLFARINREGPYGGPDTA